MIEESKKEIAKQDKEKADKKAKEKARKQWLDGWNNF
jgi:hypothetical protein